MSRLSWRCRRGTKELDVLLQRYLDRRYPHADAAERQAFEQLLELPDPVLQDYFAGLTEPQEAPLLDVVRRILTLEA